MRREIGRGSRPSCSADATSMPARSACAHSRQVARGRAAPRPGRPAVGRLAPGSSRGARNRDRRRSRPGRASSRSGARARARVGKQRRGPRKASPRKSSERMTRAIVQGARQSAVSCLRFRPEDERGMRQPRQEPLGGAQLRAAIVDPQRELWKPCGDPVDDRAAFVRVVRSRRGRRHRGCVNGCSERRPATTSTGSLRRAERRLDRAIGGAVAMARAHHQAALEIDDGNDFHALPPSRAYRSGAAGAERR